MFTRVSVWARILLVLLVVAALVLVVCARHLWLAPFPKPRPDPPQEDVALAHIDAYRLQRVIAMPLRVQGVDSAQVSILAEVGETTGERL